MVRIRKKRVVLVTLSALLALIVLLVSAAIAPAIANGGLLWLNPATTAIDKFATTDVIVQLDNVTNVYGAQFSLSFDPAVLQVVDADSGTGGIQISTGTCPNPAFVITNTADNGAGTVGYAAIQLGPSPPPCDGGDVATIEFQCIASGVSSDVTFTDSLISDPDGVEIAHTSQNGTITCLAPTPTPTPTFTPTPTPTSTPTPTPTITPTPTPTFTPTPTPTFTPTPTATFTPTPTPTLHKIYLPAVFNDYAP